MKITLYEKHNHHIDKLIHIIVVMDRCLDEHMYESAAIYRDKLRELLGKTTKKIKSIIK
jgi:hypothetical protein